MKTTLTPDNIAELGHPTGHGFICPAQIVTALDAAAVLSRAHEDHAWDYATNITEIVVDPETRTITFRTET